MNVETRHAHGTGAVPLAALPDVEIVRRVRSGDRASFEILMRRHNQRIYRAARAIVKDEADIEDVMQQAYINAFAHLHQFEERSQFSTWLIRIAVNEAIGRRQRIRPMRPFADHVEDSAEAPLESIRSTQPTPEHSAYASELQRILEDAVDELPEHYRTVFMLRDIEGCSTAETGTGLGLNDDVVKTRLHRARAMLRRAVSRRIGAVSAGAFQFRAPRCDRVVAFVLEHLSRPSPTAS